MQLAGLLSTIGLVCTAIVVLLFVIIHSMRLQRRALVTQKAAVDDHFAEKAQRQRHLALAEEALEIQRRADARAEEALQLSRRSVQLGEEILQTIRGKGTNDA
jgi:hypothetical protein